MTPRRIIAHVDLDAFFASVEERERPYLRGAPLVIGADPLGGRGRGVVSTASYKAREYGIRSAMPIREAWRRSEDARRRGEPGIIFLSPSFGRYGAASRRVMEILRRFSPAVEEASVDEAYLDLSHLGSFAQAKGTARAIKRAIRREERLTATIGVGPNKLVAKIASDAKKPDGLTAVAPNEVEAFLDPLPVRTIPGIGPRSEAFLRRLGIRTVRDAKRLSRADLSSRMGKWGAELFERLRGVDDSPLVPVPPPPKSVGEQETFQDDTLDMGFLVARLRALARSVVRRLEKEGFAGFRTLTLTVRFADFDTRSRARTLTASARGAAALERYAVPLLMPFLDRRDNPQRKKLRLLGVRVEKLES